MKKIIALMLLLSVIFIPRLATAEQVNVYENNQLVKSVVFKIGVSEYVVDGQTPGVKMDVAPFIESNRTFVPVRFLGNALGVTDSNIAWDNSSQTATLQGNATLQMTIGQARITSDGETKAIDVAPLLRSDRTFLPARFVAEGLGYEVGWDEATQTVVCWPAGQEKPDVSAAVEYLVSGQLPVQGNTVNGYVVPANTDLYIFDKPYQVAHDGKLITFQVQIKKGNLQQQYADAESILLQTLDADTTAKAIEFAKQAHVRDSNNCLPPITTFSASNGMAVRVAGGDITVQFDVWQTKK